MAGNPTLARMVDAVDELSEDSACRMIVAAFETMSDDDIVRGYNAANVESPVADLLAIVAERRNVDL